MGDTFKFLRLVFAILGTLVVLTALVLILIKLGLVPSLPLDLFLMLGAGWIAYAVIRYRQMRRSELLSVLALAAEARLPRPAAARAYVMDRPTDAQGSWDVILLFLFPPAYWLWYQRHGFDARVERLAEAMEDGQSLSEAMAAIRGVSTAEARVAAAVGESTGRLSDCLRRADREPVLNAWLEVVPRLLYPLLVLIFILGIMAFLMIAVLPRILLIFRDFRMELPLATQRLVEIWEHHESWILLFAAGLLLTIVGVSAMIAFPSLRWYVPILKWTYRWDVQGLILRMLSTMVEWQRPIPESLGRLASATRLPRAVRTRLRRATAATERGEPLGDALASAQLLPRSMTALVRSAERTGRLSWALSELGELLSSRAARWVRRASFVIAPMLLVGVGALAGVIVVGVFMPLIELLEKLS